MSDPSEAVKPEEEPTTLDTERVRVRAYEISLSKDAGTPEEDWCRAEQQLREAAAST